MRTGPRGNGHAEQGRPCVVAVRSVGRSCRIGAETAAGTGTGDRDGGRAGAGGVAGRFDLDGKWNWRKVLRRTETAAVFAALGACVLMACALMTFIPRRMAGHRRGSGWTTLGSWWLA